MELVAPRLPQDRAAPPARPRPGCPVRHHREVPQPHPPRAVHASRCRVACPARGAGLRADHGPRRVEDQRRVGLLEPRPHLLLHHPRHHLLPRPETAREANGEGVPGAGQPALQPARAALAFGEAIPATMGARHHRPNSRPKRTAAPAAAARGLQSGVHPHRPSAAGGRFEQPRSCSP
ncbi:uncharacterized protein ACA1_034490 [Acanthamoeba castellanii str. Neff]|uniref:Uncharacterized protein n=1 Tax=Acanthamoeba castellanii (strain ATCC 30010 / Neff) TaxID=1257118 RepID=L8HAU1_ACACF|nr:uncharacterized protein ACA1_034490 [Acanthamoeba castellanii str. Neff]ELR22604.1 hypothetical protein ACA1_034490 [Acanthamoeba castellanii str. Neff]